MEVLPLNIKFCTVVHKDIGLFCWSIVHAKVHALCRQLRCDVCSLNIITCIYV